MPYLLACVNEKKKASPLTFPQASFSMVLSMARSAFCQPCDSSSGSEETEPMRSNCESGNASRAQARSRRHRYLPKGGKGKNDATIKRAESEPGHALKSSENKMVKIKCRLRVTVERLLLLTGSS